MGEIQTRLHQDLDAKVTTLTTKDQQSLKNILSLRNVQSRRLNAAGDELKEELKVVSEAGCETIKDSSSTAASSINDMATSLSQEVLQAFEQLEKSTLGLATSFGEKAEAEQKLRMDEMSEILKALQAKLENTKTQHLKVLQGHHDLLERRLQELSQLSVSELTTTFERLVAELLLHKEDCVNRLNALSDELNETIVESMALCGLNIHMHAEHIATNAFIPRLMQYKQAVAASAQKLREQYKEEVEKAAALKLSELRPVLLSNREKIDTVVQNASTLKTNVEVGQKEAFEKMLVSLTEFVEAKLADAAKLAESSTQEFTSIDESVFALADAASIESHPELLEARQKVLTRLEHIGAQLQEGVNDSLRRQIAGMEDKSRMLQEELISSMEGDAYGVRKSLETSVSRVKQALEQAYHRIHALQNHYLQ